MNMHEKECFKCKQTKTIDDFYKHPETVDGRLGKCKSCTKKDVCLHRSLNLEEVRAYDRKRSSLPHRVQKNKEYEQTPAGKEKLRLAKAAWALRNPEKRAAEFAVSNAVRDGRLQRLPCYVCGSSDSEGHHEDYSRPLDVIWLCPKHHSAHHKAKREAERLAKCVSPLHETTSTTGYGEAAQATPWLLPLEMKGSSNRM